MSNKEEKPMAPRVRRVPKNIGVGPEIPLSEIADRLVGKLVNNLNANVIKEAEEQAKEKETPEKKK
jgi:hypothetical protein